MRRACGSVSAVAPSSRESRAVAWQDIDGDDVPEVTYAVADEGIVMYRLGGAGPTRISTEPLWSTPRDLGWGDFGGDGVPSLAVATDRDW